MSGIPDISPAATGTSVAGAHVPWGLCEQRRRVLRAVAMRLPCRLGCIAPPRRIQVTGQKGCGFVLISIAHASSLRCRTEPFQWLRQDPGLCIVRADTIRTMSEEATSNPPAPPAPSHDHGSECAAAPVLNLSQCTPGSTPFCPKFLPLGPAQAFLDSPPGKGGGRIMERTLLGKRTLPATIKERVMRTRDPQSGGAQGMDGW